MSSYNALAEGLARNSYWDRYFQVMAVKLSPGEFYAGIEVPLLVTVLGSCVAACIRDPVAGVAGMNHFMLPEPSNDVHSASGRYGVHAMELLLNEMYRLGARRSRLEIKLFGGANLMASTSERHVGAINGEFAINYFRSEGFRVIRRDLFGNLPRKIWFLPDSGRVMLKRLQSVRGDTLFRRERELSRRIAQGSGGDVALFED